MKTIKFFLIIITLGFFSTSLQARIWYVRAGATGNGMSASSPSGDLQLILINSSAGDEIRVTEGRYYPYRPANNPSVIDTTTNYHHNAFVLKKDVKLYGGYSLNFSSRNPYGGVSTLMGIASIVNVGRLYHTVISIGDIGTACLDGFEILGGRSFSSNSIILNGHTIYNDRGACIYLSSSSPALVNVTINNGIANGSGGGIYASACHLNITN